MVEKPNAAGTDTLAMLLAPVKDELSAAQTRYIGLIQDSLDEYLAGHFSVLSNGTLLPIFDFTRNLTAHIAQAQGKWLRAGMTLLCADAIGSNAQEAVDLAATVELIHTASLLHDDVIDKAVLRRGVPTIAEAWDNSQAVLAGDLLFSLAFVTLTLLPNRSCQTEIAQAAVQVCLGEMVQERNAGLATMTEQEYLAVIDKKTASLFKSCARCGGIIGGADESALQALSTFGHAFGIAFQVMDDVLDFLHDEHTSGKTAGGDIRQGKATLAGIHYCQQTGSELDTLDGLTVSECRKRFEKTASFDYALQIARDFADEAHNALSRLHTSEPKSLGALQNLARFVVERES